MRKSYILPLVALSSALAACNGAHRPAVISDKGVSPDVDKAQETDGLLYDFMRAAKAAMPANLAGKPSPVDYKEPVPEPRSKASDGTGTQPAASTAGVTAVAQPDAGASADGAGAAAAAPPVQIATEQVAVQRHFLRSGLALIAARCDRYMLAKSDSQRQLSLWRDLMGPVTTLATGVVTLASKGDEVDNDLVTALGLATGITGAVFTSYETRFLFGAKNVNSVRKLVLEAVNSNAKVALTTTGDKLDYIQVVTHLLNNQAVCSPGNILELVTTAIDDSKVESLKNGESADKSKDSAQADPAVLQQLLKDNVLTQAQVDAAKAKLSGAAAAKPADSTADPSIERVVTRVNNNL